MTLCAVCTMYMETRSVGFFIEPRNQGRRFVSSLSSKSLGRLWFGLKTGGDNFLWFDLKIGGDGFSWFGLKTSGGFLG
jgi:hypothetical protein